MRQSQRKQEARSKLCRNAVGDAVERQIYMVPQKLRMDTSRTHFSDVASACFNRVKGTNIGTSVLGVQCQQRLIL